MKLALLLKVAELLSRHKLLVNLKRIGDNLFKLECDSVIYYVDLTRAHSTIFTAPAPILGTKHYQAPFDLWLKRATSRAEILGVEVEDGNRILRLKLLSRGSYKALCTTLQLEFTGRNTNAILLDENGIILDALRHISDNRSFREVRIGKPLAPLPPPKEPLCEKPLCAGLSVQELLELEYQRRLERELDERKRFAIQSLEKRLGKILMLLANLGNEGELLEESARHKEDATLLLASLYKLTHFALEVELESESGRRVVAIPARARSFSEAAQILFESAKRLAQKAQNLHIEREFLEGKAAFYHRQITLISECKSLEDIDILAPKRRNSAKSEGKKEEFESFFIEGIKVSFGKNQRENVKLLQSARAEDMWLHVREIPSSHMIIHSGKGKIPQSVLQKASEILVGFLETLAGSYLVDFTKRKFVKITEGAQVVYAKHETITVKKE